jgi:hypothetical protein
MLEVMAMAMAIPVEGGPEERVKSNERAIVIIAISTSSAVAMPVFVTSIPAKFSPAVPTVHFLH